MSSLLFLTYQDFVINYTNGVNMLCTQMPGFSFVLFYSPLCHHCKIVLPEFKQLSNMINGCQFGIVNINQNGYLIEVSHKTVTPIQFVPLMMMYFNGVPIVKYTGELNLRSLNEFVINTAKQMFEEGFKFTKEKGIPSYTIGEPLWGDGTDIAYLEYSDDCGYYKK